MKYVVTLNGNDYEVEVNELNEAVVTAVVPSAAPVVVAAPVAPVAAPVAAPAPVAAAPEVPAAPAAPAAPSFVPEDIDTPVAAAKQPTRSGDMADIDEIFSIFNR